MNNNVSSVVHNTLKYSRKSVVVAPQIKPIQQQTKSKSKTLTTFKTTHFMNSVRVGSLDRSVGY